MTPSLRELQQAFAAAVLDDQPALLAHVRDGIFPAARHVQVYRNNTFANLTDALAACYPVVRRLVGEGFFDYAADGYIRRHPPTSGNLHDFGAELADFLAAFPAAQSLPYLRDVARLEWAWQQVYHAADPAALTPAALADVAPEKYGALVLHLHPSARLLQSPYPCLRIWQVNQPDFDGDTSVDLDQGGDRLLVIRRGLEIEIATLGAADYALLHAFAERRPLREATDAALVAEPGFDLGAALRRHIGAGMITGFSTHPNQ